MTSDESGGEGPDDVAAGQSNDATAGPSASDERGAEDAPEDAEDRTQRPLLAGVLGLLAGIAGGIAGTTIAPDSLVLTIVLVVGVAGAVTLGALRLLASRE